MKYNGGEYIANFKGGGYTQINVEWLGIDIKGVMVILICIMNRSNICCKPWIIV